MKIQLRSRGEFEASARSIEAETIGLDNQGEDWELTSAVINYTGDDEKPKTDIKLQLKSNNGTRGVLATIDGS